jgi:hypothetical protein
MAKNTGTDASNKRGYWNEQLDKAKQLYSVFQTGGERVVDRYRIEKADARDNTLKDRYNILYSSTETVRPSLYAQSPKVEARKRHRDRKNPVVDAAVQIIEASVQYALEENDFDDTMEGVIEDYSLPGMGQVWVRYEPQFKDETGEDGNPVTDDKGVTQQLLSYEGVAVDYVYWKDLLFGPCRYWKELPWAARRVYMSKAKATKRFGKEKADKLQYENNRTADRDRASIVEDKQAIIWEIWDKRTSEVIWYSDGYADDVLDTKPDPLKLKDFWPFPKPLRAITNTRTFVPRPFYSQYQAQAEELDNLTQRIRFLTEALNVRGVYDGSQEVLSSLLNKNGGNKLIAIENWHQFIGEKGIEGAIQWVPIDKIVQVLMELYKARDIVKTEIYEITGFADITRGVSKASETLGAQEMKQDWASARLRLMQKEVQRFIRDIVRLIAEIVSEHFTVESLALYTGFDPASNATQTDPDGAQAVQMFQQAVALLKAERARCAMIGIETDSTILPDEANERKDRLEFLGQIGAFMQQAGPMAMQYPQMQGLLTALMMFTVRTFRASRPMEQEFEAFQEAFKANPPPPQNKDGDGAARAQSAVQVTTLKVQGDAAKQDKELAFKGQQAEADRALQREQAAAAARTAELGVQVKMAELEIKRVELEIKKAELALKGQEGQLAAQDQAHSHMMDERGHELETAQTALGADQQGHDQAMDVAEGERQDYQFENPPEINPQEGGGGS